MLWSRRGSGASLPCAAYGGTGRFAGGRLPVQKPRYPSNVPKSGSPPESRRKGRKRAESCLGLSQTKCSPTDYVHRRKSTESHRAIYAKRASRRILSSNRSLGSVIKLLTPSHEYSAEYNSWLSRIPNRASDFGTSGEVA